MMRLLLNAYLIFAIGFYSPHSRAAEDTLNANYSQVFSRDFSGEAMNLRDADIFENIDRNEKLRFLSSQLETDNKKEPYLLALSSLRDKWAQSMANYQNSAPLTFMTWLQVNPADRVSEKAIENYIKSLFDDVLLMLALVRNGHNKPAAKQVAAVVLSINTLQSSTFYFEKKDVNHPVMSSFVGDMLTEAVGLVEPRTVAESNRIRNFLQFVKAWSEGAWMESPALSDLKPNESIFEGTCRLGNQFCAYGIPMIFLGVLTGLTMRHDLSNIISILGFMLASIGTVSLLVPHVEPHLKKIHSPKYQPNSAASLFADSCHNILSESLK